MRSFNQNVERIQPSASLLVMDRARQLRAEGVKIIDLGGGEPDFETPERVRLAAKADMDAGDTHYVAGKGLPSLREAIARKLREENGIPCTAEEVLVTPGGKFAIYLALTAILNPGDEALVLDPSWVSYAPIVQACGGTAVNVGLSFEDNYRITREKLEGAAGPRTKVLVVNSPNNPSGRVLTREEAETIASFAAERDLFVISDEVYETIRYDGRPHISPASLPGMAERTVTVNGFSKCAAMTGWRLGYLAACSLLLGRIFRLFQHTSTCVSGFIQTGAIQAFACGEEMEAMRRSYEGRRDLFVDGLNRIPGFTCRKPEGAFYAWAKVDRDGMSAEAVAQYILEKAQVACVPGTAYGASCEGFVRFSFANSEEDLREALARMERAFS